MRTTPLASTALAAEVAALLPKRHQAEWTVTTATRKEHPGPPATHLANGPRRFLLLLTDSGHTTLTAADTSLTVESRAPTAVAGAALRSLLPRIDRDIIRLSPPRQRQHRLQHLAEIHELLRELGTSAERFERADDTTGLSWQCGDASVSFTLRGTSATGSVSFRGGLGALERFLAPFLPPHPGPGRVRTHPLRGCGGVARRIVAAFPHAVEADEDGLVRFSDTDGGPLQGWVMPRDINGPTGPTTPVTAGVGGAGIDLMLSVLPTSA
ncbi:hypothetical protein [Streptomyces sp. NBC_00582]|uniref:hypothetical protein n=1 Tax=Streptomyces sp. NBC_00582 TaxID=2975783 RepID=UPI002E80A452|nr:hypothetical protein [Streptomyces sp. NBC_00582]WUB68345.1 hypothetical protein OG852_49435 [Streptomyces sp. NBC_00582]